MMTVEGSAAHWSGWGSEVALHRISVRAARPGPAVVVTANIHGDETVGVGAALSLAHELADDLVCGQVHLFPSLNPVGLAERTRTFGAMGPDLNRLFPGDTTGVPASRYVAWLWQQLQQCAPSALIDLHADSHDAVPYAIVDRPIALSGARRTEMAACLDALAQATGLLALRDYADVDYKRFGLDRSLAGAWVNYGGVPAVTIEAGPRAAMATGAERVAVMAVRRVLAHLGLIAPIAPALTSPAAGPWRRTTGPRARAEGVLRPLLTAGAHFEHGQVLARIEGLSGEHRDELRAVRPGLLVAWTCRAWVTTGQAVATVASREDL